MKTAVISFTASGGKLNGLISGILSADSYKDAKNIYALTGNLMKEYDALIFIGAAGIAVRAIAPYIKSKDIDPAVIVCDERGKFVIPVLSGHIGGANRLARELAEKINAQPVITTATDINKVWAVDSWASENGFYIENIKNIKYISSALLRKENVGLDSDFKINGLLPENISFGSFENGVVISPFLQKTFKNTLNIVPKCISLGIGCRKDTKLESIEELFVKSGISPQAVREISTVDIKKDETALKEFAHKLGVPLNFYTAQELEMVEGDFSESEFVRKVAGVGNVCERAAAKGGGKLIIKKMTGDGVTLAAAMDDMEITF